MVRSEIKIDKAALSDLIFGVFNHSVNSLNTGSAPAANLFTQEMSDRLSSD